MKTIRPRGISFKFHLGQFIDKSVQSMMSPGLDMVLVTAQQKDEELNDILYSVWDHLKLDGIVVVDHMRSNNKSFEVFKSFCKVRSREYVFFDTRYGNAAVQK